MLEGAGLWKENGGGREPLPAIEGGRRMGRGGAGCGAEPQVGEERVFPVSHEVIPET